MELLSIREKEIFETLNKIRKYNFVIIGGYAVNAYTLPRFSIDCDIVIKDKEELYKIEKILLKSEYKKAIEKNGFAKYEKDLGNYFKVNIDVLIKEVFDRQTNAIFLAGWIFENSNLKILKGKTIKEELKLRILNIDALFTMKVISGRITDIRDVFMLAPAIKNKEWIKHEIMQRYDIAKLLSKIEEKILSKRFRDDLQGVYGFIEDRIFDKHKNAVLDLAN